MDARTKYSFYVEPRALEVRGRPKKFLRAMAAVLEHSNYAVALDTYARLAARCARCAASCQLYETTGQPEDIPCQRSELLLRVYRRYFTPAGLLRARLFGGFVLTDQYLDEMAEAYYRCTACRRCKNSCPLGIDHGLITHLGRWLLAEIDVIPKALVVAVREQLEGVGNTSAIPVPALKDTCEFLEEELQDIYRVEVKFPFDVEGAEYVFFPAVSDFLLEADTLMGNAAVMHVTGGSWTIGTGNYDGINYGLFYSDRMMERIVNKMVAEVRRLKAEKILIGECGHATRAAWYVPTFAGPHAPPVVNCMEYAHQMLEAGKLPLKRELIEDRVTYHDPCNIARAGRIVEQPREILKAICRDFVEMTPNRTENYCCGGGGGTVSIDEIRAFRTGPSGRRKAEQIRATGARYVVSPCANCKKQLREVCQDNGLDDVEVVGLHDLLLQVIDFGVPSGRPAEREATPVESDPPSTSTDRG
ncbi:MAG TPA: (Fe-S)-binding protein [Planctomycetes bacterium]|nr:(Fe-S)-binding protein [Planctomycetota bacterium]